MTLPEFNALTDDAARAELSALLRLDALGGEGMLARRPFADKAALLAASDASWAETGSKDDWLEAFAHHPRIGGKDALRAKFAATKSWAQGEQAAVAAADEATLDALESGNAEYEARFGRIFLVCATGKSAGEMLALLKARLPNERAAELKIAAVRAGQDHQDPTGETNLMSPITTHVLDTALGRPGGGLPLLLAKSSGAGWARVGPRRRPTRRPLQRFDEDG